MVNNNPYASIPELLPVDLQGWNSVSPVFEYLVDFIKPTTIIEVGTWKGASTVHMGSICKKLGLNTKIYTIDTFAPTAAYPDVPSNLFEQFLSNVIHAQLQDMITPLKMTSDEAFMFLNRNDVRAQLIYLDGNHEYEFVARDIANFRHLVIPGGVLFGDDYIGWPGVIQAVDEYRARHTELLTFQSHHEKWMMQLP